MKTTAQIYKQFLVGTQTNYTCTYLSDHKEKLDENSVYRFLQNNTFSPAMVWEKAKDVIKLSENGYILFDDTVLDKNASFDIEGVRTQYSGNAHGLIKGIGVVNCIYYNPEADDFWIIDFRIFDPERDGKTKIDHVHDMITLVMHREIPFTTVLMDSWYAVTKTLRWIDALGKTYYCPIKVNRKVSEKREDGYKQVKTLEWTQEDVEYGKTVKVHKFPMDTKVKLFRLTISTNRTDYVITNDMSQNSSDDCQKETAIRWKIEQFHREMKQNTGIEKCQCRSNRSQRNHITLTTQVWVFLHEKAKQQKTTIYELKCGLLDDYMVRELRNPSLVYA